jgi:putative photosynthetic complex assembly protein 2
LDNLPRSTFRWSALAATGVAGLGLYGTVATAPDTTLAGGVWAFLSAIAIWGWHEMTFLRGYITGPHKTPLEPGVKGWKRFIQATNTVIWHELALVLTGIAILALTWSAPNQFALWTFMLLWGMRLSAKLNLFLGVPNFALDLFPERLKHMRSFTAKKPMNALFPVSVTLGTAGSVLLAQQALAAGATPLDQLGFALLATLLALAVLEHWFLVLPLPDEALWAWARKPRAIGRPVQNCQGMGIETTPASKPFERLAGGSLTRDARPREALSFDRRPVLTPTPLSGSVDR